MYRYEQNERQQEAVHAAEEIQFHQAKVSFTGKRLGHTTNSSSFLARELVY